MTSHREELYKRAVAIVLREQKASASFLERSLKITYNEAAGLLTRMEKAGIVSALPELEPDAFRRRVLSKQFKLVSAVGEDSPLAPLIDPPDRDASDELPTKQAADVALLTSIATFNGLCRLITALSEQRILSLHEVQGIHDAMATPLDDPDMRDDKLIADARRAIDTVIAKAAATIADDD